MKNYRKILCGKILDERKALSKISVDKLFALVM